MVCRWMDPYWNRIEAGLLSTVQFWQRCTCKCCQGNTFILVFVTALNQMSQLYLFLFQLQVLVIITDGESTGGMKTLMDPIKKLKESRVNIISIGVGHKTNKHELNFMASSPANTHVFSVNNMDQLRALIGSITSSSCSSKFC